MVNGFNFTELAVLKVNYACTVISSDVVRSFHRVRVLGGGARGAYWGGLSDLGDIESSSNVFVESSKYLVTSWTHLPIGAS